VAGRGWAKAAVKRADPFSRFGPSLIRPKAQAAFREVVGLEKDRLVNKDPDLLGSMAEDTADLAPIFGTLLGRGADAPPVRSVNVVVPVPVTPGGEGLDGKS